MTDEQVWVTVYAAVLQGLLARTTRLVVSLTNTEFAEREADFAVERARRKRESDWL